MASTTQNGHENETKEKCPICLTTDLIDPSIPGGCGNDPGHKFCYTCLRTWFKNNPSCPLCGLQSTFIRHQLTLDDGCGKIEPLSELKKEFLKEKIKEESEKIPLDVEKQLLHKYYRSLNTRLNKLDEQVDRDPKGHKRKPRKDRSQSRDYERHRRKLVQAINMIKSLQESCENQTIDRLTLNQNPYYRGMVYDMHLRREDVSTNDMRRNFGPQMAKEELEVDSSRLRNWLRKEIPILLNMDQILDLEEKVDSVLMAVQQGHIHAPEFEAICRRVFREARDHLDVFCNEFFDFASSQYSMEMFFQNSRYKAAEANRNEGPDRPAEVIHLDDYVPIDNDVQIVGSSHHSNEYLDYLARQQRQQRQRIQSGHTDSEEEEGADIYMHPACRIPSQQPSASTRHRRYGPKTITRGAPTYRGISLNQNWPMNLATVLQNLIGAPVPAVTQKTSTPGEEIVLSSDDEGPRRAFDVVAGRDGESPSRSLKSSLRQMPSNTSYPQNNRKLRKRAHPGPSKATYQEEDSDPFPIPPEGAPTGDEILRRREERRRNRSASYSWSPSDNDTNRRKTQERAEYYGALQNAENDTNAQQVKRWSHKAGEMTIGERLRRAARSRSYSWSPSDEDTASPKKRERGENGETSSLGSLTERTATEDSNLPSTSASTTLMDVAEPTLVVSSSTRALIEQKAEETLESLLNKATELAGAKGLNNSDYKMIRLAVKKLNELLPENQNPQPQLNETGEASTSTSRSQIASEKEEVAARVATKEHKMSDILAGPQDDVPNEAADKQKPLERMSKPTTVSPTSKRSKGDADRKDDDDSTEQQPTIISRGNEMKNMELNLKSTSPEKKLRSQRKKIVYDL